MTFWASIWPLTALCKDIVASLWGCDLSFSVLCSGRLGSCVYVSQSESLLIGYILTEAWFIIDQQCLSYHAAFMCSSDSLRYLLTSACSHQDVWSNVDDVLHLSAQSVQTTRWQMLLVYEWHGRAKETDHVSHEVYNQPNVYFRSPWFSVIWCQLSNRTNIFSDFLICCSELLRHSCESS